MNKEDPDVRSIVIPLLVFAVAMGILEAVVVIYVRELYYPEGFGFPLKALPPRLVAVELIREFSTLLMLMGVAWLTGKTFLRRLNAFILLFGIWDIMYYVTLKFLLDWPESLLTSDILFLIPVIWTGPVLAPVLCSVLMILMAALFEWLYKKEKLRSIRQNELLWIFLGSLLIFVSFIYDFGKIILKGGFLHDFFNLTNNTLFNEILTAYIPGRFKWELFSAGIILIIGGCVLIFRRSQKEYSYH